MIYIAEKLIPLHRKEYKCSKDNPMPDAFQQLLKEICLLANALLFLQDSTDQQIMKLFKKANTHLRKPLMSFFLTFTREYYELDHSTSSGFKNESLAGRSFSNYRNYYAS